MAYAFNPDKSITEVYRKKDFVVITGSVEIGASENTKTVSFSDSTLLNEYGIDNINKYVVLSVQQTVALNNDWKTAYKVTDGGVYPFVSIGTLANSRLGVHIDGSAYATAHTYYYRVVLLRI